MAPVKRGGGGRISFTHFGGVTKQTAVLRTVLVLAAKEKTYPNNPPFTAIITEQNKSQVLTLPFSL